MPAVHARRALQGCDCACWASTPAYEHSQIDRRQEAQQRRSLSPLSCACLAGSTVRGHPRLCARVFDCDVVVPTNRRGILSLSPFFFFFLVGFVANKACGCDTGHWADTKLSEARQPWKSDGQAPRHTREIASERAEQRQRRSSGFRGRSAETGSHRCHRHGQHSKTAAMEEQDRITITICGDGGCGTSFPPTHTVSLSLQHTMLIPTQEKAP